jgi:SAM-dependent methyltransferase
MKTCPLCSSNKSSVIDVLDYNTVTEIYRTEYNVDVSTIIDRDVVLYQCSDCDLKYFDSKLCAGGDLYGHLQTFEWYYPSEKFEYDQVAPWIGPQDHVLEVGCGRATFSDKLATPHYQGLDFNPDVHKGVKVLNQTLLQHSQIKPNFYDYVVAFNVLEHVPNPRSFIKEALTCLKPNGKLILSLPADSSWLGQARLFGLNMPPHHITRWPDSTVKNIADLFNLELTRLIFDPFVENYQSKFVEPLAYTRGDLLIVEFVKR